ncbi:MAG TPA: TldD/PmbA family protein [bacterium]|nr:TldD/PmbA family protein [bacterium]
MISETIISDVLSLARAGGASFAEVYAERWKSRSLRVLNNEAKEANSGLSYGAGVRLFFGEEIVYAYTNDLTGDDLRDVTTNLVRLKGRGGRVDPRGRGGLDFRKTTARGLHRARVSFDAQPKSHRLALLKEADAGARIAPEIQQVDSLLNELDQDVLVANSDGVWAEDRRVRTRLRVVVVAQDGTDLQTGSYAPGLSMGLEFFDRYSPRDVGRRSAEQALTNLRAKPAPAGTMPVVIGNAFGGVIFHEALGHLLETTSVARKASVLTDKLGEQIASRVVTYVDDGTTPHAWGSSEFDDEGAATERTVLIDRGDLKSYMVDRWGALMTGYRPTGSGRREDYTYAPTSRMRNTFIMPGDASIEDLFDGIEFGLYAKDMGGGQVRPGSGEYNFGVKEAYVIRRGRLEEPVRGAMLVGKGPDTIMKIVAIAGDLETSPGMCGSLSGSIPVEVGQPHLLVSEIVVGGEAT